MKDWLRNLFIRDGDPIDIIPEESYWLFRWGIPAIRTVLSLRDYEQLLDRGYSGGTMEAQIALERYRANQFSCIYGWQYDVHQRMLIEKLKKELSAVEGISDIFSRNILRGLIRFGKLRVSNSDTLRVAVSKREAIAGGVYIFSCIVLLALISLLIVVCEADVYLKLFLLIGYWGVLVGCVAAIFSCAVRPFLIDSRFGNSIEKIGTRILKRQRSVNLVIV